MPKFLDVTDRESARSVLGNEVILNVADYGIVSDSGTTDNLSAITSLIGNAPEGSTIYFPPTNDDSYYGVSGQIVVDKSIHLKGGGWNRATTSGPVNGSRVAIRNAGEQLAAESCIKITKARVKISDLSVGGYPTKETDGTISVNGTTVQLSSLTATNALVGARVSGTGVPVGTVVSSVDTGANTVALSNSMLGEAITYAESDANSFTYWFKGDHDLEVGDQITTTGFTPSAYNGTFTVSAVTSWRTIEVASVANPGIASVLGSYTAAKSGCELWFGADGIEFDGDATDRARFCNIERVKVTGFGQGVVFGYSDHVTFERGCEIGGNYDGVAFLSTNRFDYAFIASLLVGNVRSSLHIGKSTSVVNLSCVRCHLGFGEYGIFQDYSTSGNGLKGLSLVSTPIEAVSGRHVRIINGGAMLFDASGYWTWTDPVTSLPITPTTPAFTISGIQNYGDINFMAALEGTNANCPSVIYIASQTGSGVVRFMSQLDSFAVAKLWSAAGVAERITGQVYLSGTVFQTSSACAASLYGSNYIYGTTTFHDPSASTKKFQLDMSGITAGQTRTMTIPDSPSRPAPFGATAYGGSGAENGANTWAKIATITAPNNGTMDIVLACATDYATAPDSAIVQATVRSNGVSVNPTLKVWMLAKGGAGGASDQMSSSAFKLIAPVATGAGVAVAELWVNKAIANGRVAFFEIARAASSTGTISYNDSGAWQSATPTNTNTASSAGVTAFGNPVSVRVSVPANATTAAQPGHWAADSSYIYTYTGDGTTHTWVRASAAAW